MIQPELNITRIGTCHSCRRQPCWKPRQPKLRPEEGCAEWHDGITHPDDHLLISEADMPPLDIPREKRIAELLNTSVDDCKASLQHIDDRELLEHLHRRAENLDHKTRSKYIQQRLNQLNKVKA